MYLETLYHLVLNIFIITYIDLVVLSYSVFHVIYFHFKLFTSTLLSQINYAFVNSIMMLDCSSHHCISAINYKIVRLSLLVLSVVVVFVAS